MLWMVTWARERGAGNVFSWVNCLILDILLGPKGGPEREEQVMSFLG